ncbi:unnamed protein product [Dovyalis caffra]|uniref:Wall-associated receptor kinase galacturonan-binding domain-containing protein n=1 Tax=Dovyalis caffra TaxID=77055 RepID=A0AAV1S5R5_9ROSI|nr:unnamed protein product [Dovyalis caffra]
MGAVQFVVLQLTLLLLMFWSFSDPLVIAEAQVPIANYGCRDSCGNVTIPYPFGMEKKGCYIEERFKVHCNSTSGVPTISISGIDMEVTNISVDYNTITVNFPVVYANCEGKDSKSSTVVDLEGSPFAFSSAENYFIAKGCNNVALATPKNEDSPNPWCVSFCDKESDNGPDMSGCSNITWYLNNIPSHLKVFNVTFEGFDDRRKSGSSNNSRKLEECRHAFLIEQTRVDNSAPDMRDVDFVPAVLDWGIDNEIFRLFVESQGCHISTSIHRCGASGPPIDSSSRPNSTIRCYSTLIPDYHNPYLDSFCEGKRNGNRTKMVTIVMLYYEPSLKLGINRFLVPQFLTNFLFDFVQVLELD